MRTSLTSEAIALAQELVRSDSPSGAEQVVADAVAGEMAMLGYESVTRDGLGSVVGTVHGARPGRTVLFDAHMDVVPVPDPAAWRVPPFGGEVRDGRLWGRGATDVKGSLAALVVAVGRLRREALHGTVLVAATVGEELTEGLALGQVLRAHPADRAVVCEPTGLRVGAGHKGRAGLVIEASGVPAHSSRPEEGVNAVYRMLEAIERLRALTAQHDDLLGSGVSELVEIISDPYPGTSMVPAGCRARFDRRLVRGETRETLLHEVRGALAGLDGVAARLHTAPLRCYTGASFDVEDIQLAWALPIHAPLVLAAGAALRAAGQEGRVYMAPYCTNASVSAGVLGVPTILYGAGEISDAHGIDESLALDQLAAAVEGYGALASHLGRP